MMHGAADQLSQAELQVFRKLTTPAQIQRFLAELGYNLEPRGVTCYSPRMVLRERVAHCMEGALVGAAALRFLGFPALLVDLEGVRDSDHVLAVYKLNGGWGAVAKSDYSGLRSREPVYRTISELAMSYFEHYFNPRGEKTLRTYARPVDLKRFDKRGWIVAEGDVWYIPEYLCEVPHKDILTPKMVSALSHMDDRLYKAGRLGGLGP